MKSKIKKAIKATEPQTTLSLVDSKKDYKTYNKAVLTNLVREPIQNSNSFFWIKDSSISSFIEYSDKIKNLAKEKKTIKYTNLINDSLTTSHIVENYLQSPLNLNKSKSKSKPKSKSKSKSNLNSFYRLDTPFFSGNSISSQISLNSSPSISTPGNMNLAEKTKKFQSIKKINLTSLHKPKSYSKSFLDFIPALRLWKKEQQLFHFNRVQLSKSEVTVQQNLLMTKINLIRTINPLSTNMAQSNKIMYYFNKKTTYNIIKNEKNISVILVSAFDAMGGSLISKSYIYGKPNSFLINLFFFWKFDALELLESLFDKWEKIRKNKRINLGTPIPVKKYSNIEKLPYYVLNRVLKTFESNYNFSIKWSRFATFFDKHFYCLTLILPIILNKEVNFQFTRIYYPYNESKIMAEFMGVLSFIFKFNFIVLRLFTNVIFRIRNKRKIRLQYMHIPSVTTGMNVKLAGRISKIRSNNRSRSKFWQLGNLTNSVNNLTVKNRFTNKSINGVFSVTVNSNAIVIK